MSYNPENGKHGTAVAAEAQYQSRTWLVQAQIHAEQVHLFVLQCDSNRRQAAIGGSRARKVYRYDLY